MFAPVLPRVPGQFSRCPCGFGAYVCMTQKFKLGRDFRTMHLPPKFRHPTFTRSEVIVLTNKQTDAAENIQCVRYATTLGN